MISTIDLTAVVQGALVHGCAAHTQLSPLRVQTLAIQIAQFLSTTDEKAAAVVASTVNQSGMSLHHLLVVWQVVQAMHLRYNAPCAVLETARRMSDLIEQFVEQQQNHQGN